MDLTLVSETRTRAQPTSGKVQSKTLSTPLGSLSKSLILLTPKGVPRTSHPLQWVLLKSAWSSRNIEKPEPSIFRDRKPQSKLHLSDSAFLFPLWKSLIRMKTRSSSQLVAGRALGAFSPQSAFHRCSSCQNRLFSQVLRLYTHAQARSRTQDWGSGNGESKADTADQLRLRL